MIEKDLLVIGAGPAGSTAAKFAAKKGLDTLVIEKRQEIGTPIRCAEGVGKNVEEFVEIENDFISKDVEGAKIFSPNQELFEMAERAAGDEVGYILERKKFDQYLVEKAIEEGAEVKLRTRAKDIERDGDSIITKAIRNGKKIKIKSKIVIAADGVESRIGRLTGIIDSLSLKDIESCAQYLVTGIEDIDLDYTHFYLGKEIAPGGYAWIFPKGPESANVGLGVQPTRASKKPKEYLDEFMTQLGLEDGKIIEEMFGGVPVAEPLETAIDDNIMLVGDAARQADPITGGGIINGIKAGKIAAEAAKRSKENENYSKDTLKYYEEKRKQEIALKNKRNYQLKELFQSLGDEKYNSIVSSLKGTDFEKISVASLVSELIEENPEIAEEIKEII
ncbi:digeranylgeranylglycerophospholipid reductase [archaeon SCG-AAA382B04]|nr:digeranylgeranylglycerophospholipid reductase [archaeon SCG-AAA382B04]